MAITLTAAPRSTVTHGVSALRSRNYSHETICGREIREDWAGEMDEGIPAGVPTCKRCAANQDGGFPVLRPVRKFEDGQRVGILTGIQGPEGGTVTSYGTVVRAEEFWSGQLDYIVRTDSGDELVYRVYLLSDDISGDLARKACMDAHPAGKGRRFTTTFSDGFKVRRLTPVSDTVAVIMAARSMDESSGRMEYVVATLDLGSPEWRNGRYVYGMARADSLFSSRVRTATV